MQLAQLWKHCKRTLILGCLIPTLAWAQTWQVNLQQADIGIFIQQVAEMTGKSFIVDPRVKGKVTVISNADLNEDAVFRLFLSVLTVHGYAAIESPEGIKILPQNVAKQGGLAYDKDGLSAGELLVTRVIAIKNAVASELVPILRPLIPQYGHLASVNEVNALIISDHAANIRELESLIERLDNTVEGKIQVISLEHAWAGDILDLINELVGAGAAKGNGAASTTKIIADERTNRLVVKGKEAELAQIQALVKQLDQPARKSSRLKVLPLRYADAVKTAELVNGLVGKGNEEGTSRPTNTFVQADESMNAIVVSAEPNTMAEIQSILQELDIPRAQVLVEAVIVEVKMEGSESLGFQWLFGDTSGSDTPVVGTNFSAAGSSINDIAAGVATGTPALSNGLTLGVASFNDNGDLNLAGILQAIQSNSNANLLSTPKVLTMDNQKAKILVGETRPFQTGGYADSSSNAFVTTKREDVGLTLEVTPHINAGDEVRMEVLQIVEAASPEASSLGTITTKREIETTVIAANQSTVVLGGLIEDNIVEIQQKVPLLGDIPLLGALFRSTSYDNQKKNLLVFIRPTIIRSQLDADRVTADKFSAFRSLELTQPLGSARPDSLESRFLTPQTQP
ncbi:type II secretion system protein GspD [Maribrevibacterium harenarium]|uniref:Type II secretion system protein GspD n=1 Tax=Maribrevibacterium harenarium TaxID=2589817 RepID=A0A501WWQ5_9GAMM|nr:type II secretion system secretin GspD [Maribrevibacterium harenarium]TPE50306.1 type II secretion system protein GspD [Maribrevibacterium harenarium]